MTVQWVEKVENFACFIFDIQVFLKKMFNITFRVYTLEIQKV